MEILRYSMGQASERDFHTAEHIPVSVVSSDYSQDAARWNATSQSQHCSREHDMQW